MFINPVNHLILPILLLTSKGVPAASLMPIMAAKTEPDVNRAERALSEATWRS